MTIVKVQELVGNFAENKEQAKRLRQRTILPALRRGDEVVLDFAGVALVTQSFIHAVIAEAIRDSSCCALDRLVFRNCTDNVRALIEIVVSYSQDDWSEGVAADVPPSPSTLT